MIALPTACRHHRAILLDFVDRGEASPGTRQALAHLDQCDQCLSVLETAVVTITALRRIGAEIAAVEPEPDSWPRLRARIGDWRPRWPAFMSPIASAVMSMAIVVVLSAPYGRAGGVTFVELGTDDGPSVTSLLIEQRFIATARSWPMASVTTAGRFFAGDPSTFPDGTRPQRKEVTPTKVSVKTLTPS